MVSLGSHHRFYLYRQATDMRKSFDGLCGIIRSELGVDPCSGDVHVFINRRRDRIKLLIWDRGGFWLLYHRLEAGTFQVPRDEKDGLSMAICYEELVMLVEGIDLSSVKRRRRYAS